MAKCQRTRVRGGGAINCRNNAMPGSRFCRTHSGSAVAARSERRRRRDAARRSGGRSGGRRGGNDGCGLFLVGLAVMLAALVGLLV
jgi:hypothetical protein